VGLCVAAAILASAVRILIVAGSMADGATGMFDEAMVRMVLQAGEARATGIRIVGLLFTGITLVTARPRSMLAPMGAVIAATSFVWIGHTWAVKTGYVLIALLGLHLLSVAFWLGALVPLLIITRENDLLRTAAIVARFGNAAVGVVCTLIAAGATLLWVLLGAVSELWTSPYGRVIVIKLGLVACLLGLAAFNKVRLTPRLRAGDPTAAVSFDRSIQFEMLSGVLILMATAIATTLTGPPTLE
jgi:putative copper export protein